ncbi:CAP domain-containing protein [Streptomyces sp. NPDC056069]|uniref:CAP domain-containing protein n=1 Tax=Streptomyces sp. NPDC056069 TaxID=3345702 RepID=UPI0035DD347E
MYAKEVVISSLVMPLTLATALMAPAFSTPQASAASRVDGRAEALTAAYCADQDKVIRPRSAYPDTKIGEQNYRLQSSRMEIAVACLVNQERAARGLPGVSVPRILCRIGPGAKCPPAGLGGAAYDHASEAVKLRWWTTVANYPSCTPRKDDPNTSRDESLLCDPHVNPVTKSTPQQRAQERGYGSNCSGGWRMAENVYTAAGRNDLVTPKAAFDWWMSSPGHRANILDPEFNSMTVRVMLGSADPTTGSAGPAATYVQRFGRCYG